MATHAQDMLNLLDALGIHRCHLYGHSTGGIICSYMLVKQPERFSRVLMLDPVTPLGLELAPGQIDVLTQMRTTPPPVSPGWRALRPPCSSPRSMVPGRRPQYALTAAAAQRQLFDRIIERTTVLSDGIWFGTPQNLAKEWAFQGAGGANAGDVARAPACCAASSITGCRASTSTRWPGACPAAAWRVFPHIGHSMNLEQPALFARIFTEYFRPV